MTGAKFALARLSAWGGRHGGYLRTAQLRGLINSALANSVVVETEKYSPASQGDKWRYVLGALREGISAKGYRINARELGYVGLCLQVLKDYELDRGDVVMFDADKEKGPALASVLERRGLSLVAFPHNFEALFPQSAGSLLEGEFLGHHMRQQLEWLTNARQIWAISAFDKELFELVGLPAHVLPYRPPEDKERSLLSIRASRQCIEQDNIVLVLGTVTNLPTYSGMSELLNFLKSRAPPCEVVVAGFGTESLASLSGPGIKVVGQCTDAELAGLLTKARALWAHQAPMTGSLTRITETLYAGVPIVANRWAAKGSFPNVGLQIYESFDDALNILNGPLSVPDIPDISAFEVDFMRKISALS